MRRKIYYIANARMPTEKAHGIQIAKMCEALIEAGTDVELVVPKRRTDERTLKDFYGLRVEIPVTRLGVMDWYDKGRIGFWISSGFFMFAYGRYLGRARPHAAGVMLWAIDIDQFSFALVPLLGVPYVAEIHDAKSWSAPFALFFRRAGGIVVINRLIKEKISAAFGIRPEKIAVCPNGIDLKMFSGDIPREDARERLGLPREKTIALYAGQFYSWKGLGIMRDAAALLPDVDFYFVGGGADDYRAASGRAPMPNMRFAGYRPYEDMPQWLAAADVLVLLGTRDGEYSYLHTSPMKLFEYMASRRPIVAADTPANRQVVSSDEAVFYRPDDAADLARKIHFVREYAVDAADRAERARMKVAQFAWEKRAKDILGFMAGSL